MAAQQRVLAHWAAAQPVCPLLRWWLGAHLSNCLIEPSKCCCVCGFAAGCELYARSSHSVRRSWTETLQKSQCCWRGHRKCLAQRLPPQAACGEATRSGRCLRVLTSACLKSSKHCQLMAPLQGWQQKLCALCWRLLQDTVMLQALCSWQHCVDLLAAAQPHLLRLCCCSGACQSRGWNGLRALWRQLCWLVGCRAGPLSADCMVLALRKHTALLAAAQSLVSSAAGLLCCWASCALQSLPQHSCQNQPGAGHAAGWTSTFAMQPACVADIPGIRTWMNVHAHICIPVVTLPDIFTLIL